MPKKKGKQEQGDLFPEVNELVALLAAEAQQDLVILVVPSHDKKNRPLDRAKVREWASNGLELMSDLYRGGTAYRTFKGVYKTSAGEYLWDRPILLESFAMHDDIMDLDNLNELVKFAKRMGKLLDQDAVMIVVKNVMFYIDDYSGV